MNNYIFLDNWVLSNYTKNNKLDLLSQFISKHNYTILINSLLLVELYNPGWQKKKDSDRTTRAAGLIANYPSAIVDVRNLWNSELENYPNKIHSLPLALSLDNISFEHRAPVLLRFLRRDKIFIEMGKDIAVWAEKYKAAKTKCLNEAKEIIKNACDNNVLDCVDGKFRNLKNTKENFLRTLDGRHYQVYFESSPKRTLRITLQDIKDGATRGLPAIRASSLYFWYSYIDADRNFPMKREGSDIGDYFQMSLLPYCSVFTTDTTMSRLAKRVSNEMGLNCKILNQEDLEKELSKLG